MGTIIKMNFASFDLNLLRVFDALMRERSVTRAGEIVGLSQPAVSNALGRLRHAMDDELFVRRNHDMVPTPRAEALAEEVREALSQIERVLSGDEAFDPAKAKRTFTLHGSDYFSTLTMPILFSRTSAVAPGIRFRLLEGAAGDVESLLRDNAVDVALERALPMPDWISSDTVLHEDFVIVAAKDNPLIADAGFQPGEEIPMPLFCKLQHALRSVDGSMSGVVDEKLAEAGFCRQVMLALPQFNSVAVAVSQGRLIAALPRQTAGALAGALGLAVFAPPVPLPAQELRMYWHRRHDRNPAHSWLRDQVRSALDDLTKGSAN